MRDRLLVIRYFFFVIENYQIHTLFLFHAVKVLDSDPNVAKRLVQVFASASPSHHDLFRTRLRLWERDYAGKDGRNTSQTAFSLQLLASYTMA